jgi:hypothetical protein
LEFHEMAPTRPLCPPKLWIFLYLMQSHSCTCPEWVPTPKTWDDALDEVLVIRSF